MPDLRHLAVHHVLRAHHPAAESMADRLMAEADAEQRYPPGRFRDQSQGDARLVRRARPGPDRDVRGPQRLDLDDRNLVVSENPDRDTQLLQVLHQVVREGIVVVDHRDHAASATLSVDASSAALRMARALCWVSSHSECGSESATMPAAACTCSLPSFTTAVRIAIATSMSPLKPR